MKDDVLAQSWIPVCETKELSDKPLKAEVLGERIALFRASSGVKALKDLCVHRGVALSLGAVKNDCLVCPYHGWEYGGDGRCVHIPQLPDNQAIPLKARVPAYGCLEKYGLIWVNLGNNRPPEPAFRYLDEENFQSILFGPETVRCAAPRFIENVLDVAHFAFTHDGYLGDSSRPLIPDYRVREEGSGLLVSDDIACYQPNADARGGLVNHYRYEIPGPLAMTAVKLDKETGDIVYIVTAVCPIDERTTKVFMLFAANFGMDWGEFYDYQRILFEQDRLIVENQKPEELPLDLQAELHLNPDRLSIAYRKMLRGLGVSFGTA